MAQLFAQKLKMAHTRIIRLGLSKTPLSYLREIQSRGVTSNENISIVKKMQLLVEFPHRPFRLPICFSPMDTHYHIANIIRNFCSCDISFCDLKLPVFITRGRFALLCEGKRRLNLDDEPITLEEWGIKHMDTIQLFFDASFRIDVIRVSSDGKVEEGFYVIVVKSYDTVGELKEKIEEVTGVPKQEQRLKYKRWYLEQDKRILAYYGIEWSSSDIEETLTSYWSDDNPLNGGERMEIYLDSINSESKTAESENLQVFLEVSHMTWRYPLFILPPIFSIDDLKLQIWFQLYCQTDTIYDIEIPKLELAFGTKVLNDESMHDGYGIKHMDSITVFENTPICINIINLECKTENKNHFVEVRSFDTVGMLKETLENIIRIPKKQQELAYKNAWINTHLFLEDEERRFVDYGIFNHKIWNLKDPRHLILVATSKEVI